MVRRSLLRGLAALVVGPAAAAAVDKIDVPAREDVQSVPAINRTPEWLRPGWGDLQQEERKRQTQYHYNGLDCDLHTMRSPAIWWKHAIQRKRTAANETWFAKLRHKVWN